MWIYELQGGEEFEYFSKLREVREAREVYGGEGFTIYLVEIPDKLNRKTVANLLNGRDWAGRRYKIE